MKVYVVSIQYQGVTDTIEVFDKEQDAIDKFAETLKNDIPGIGHKIVRHEEDFWYVHWEDLDKLLEDTKYCGSMMYHCELPGDFCKVEDMDGDSYFDPEIKRLQETMRSFHLAYANLEKVQAFAKSLGLENALEHIDNMLLAISESKERNKKIINAFMAGKYRDREMQRRTIA